MQYLRRPGVAGWEISRMIRLFNHYFHAWTLRRIFFDFLFSLLALAGVILVQAESLSRAVPMAGAQVFTLATGLFVINSASGLYQRAQEWSLVESAMRAALALALGLLLAYQIFSLRPVGFGNMDAIRTSAMLVMAALILRRVVIGFWAIKARAGSRVLVFGAGPAARRWWDRRCGRPIRSPPLWVIFPGPTRSNPPSPRPSACRSSGR